LIAIIGLHEVGHKTVCDIRQIEASMPYFIPAPPPLMPMGTIGAVILQKEPPVNRDAMFDLGSAGPVVGFLVTLAVTVVGLRMSFVVDASTVEAWSEMYPGALGTVPVPFLFILLIRLVQPSLAAGGMLIFSPIATVGWFGMLLTFLNLLPIWQFDGGWVARAVLGQRLHRWASYAGIAAMVAAGFWVMALLALFGMSRASTVAPLDDVSPVTTPRKVLSLALLAVVGLCAIYIPYF
jgi:membrane-associated protease RseP (regulator of RpoE activity)